MHLSDEVKQAGMEAAKKGLLGTIGEIITLIGGALFGAFVGRFLGKDAMTAAKKAANGDESAKEELKKEIERGFGGLGMGDEAIVLRNIVRVIADFAILYQRELADGDETEAAKIKQRMMRFVSYLAGLEQRVLKRFSAALSILPTQEERNELVQNLLDITALEDGPDAGSEEGQNQILEMVFKLSRIDVPPLSEHPAMKAATKYTNRFARVFANKYRSTRATIQQKRLEEENPQTGPNVDRVWRH